MTRHTIFQPDTISPDPMMQHEECDDLALAELCSEFEADSQTDTDSGLEWQEILPPTTEGDHWQPLAFADALAAMLND